LVRICHAEHHLVIPGTNCHPELARDRVAGSFPLGTLTIGIFLPVHFHKLRIAMQENREWGTSPGMSTFLSATPERTTPELPTIWNGDCGNIKRLPPKRRLPAATV